MRLDSNCLGNSRRPKHITTWWSGTLRRRAKLTHVAGTAISKTIHSMVDYCCCAQHASFSSLFKQSSEEGIIASFIFGRLEIAAYSCTFFFISYCVPGMYDDIFKLDIWPEGYRLFRVLECGWYNKLYRKWGLDYPEDLRFSSVISKKTRVRIFWGPQLHLIYWE